MSWPTPQDYNEAIQNPKVCFGDAELRDGTPELTPLGLPKPISGAFASVYQMNCGPRRWAVRCFLREVSDHQARYQAISRHLLAARLPSTVGFEFLSQGIRIRGQWYPILKMEWIDGEPLNLYIERHLNNPAALQTLASRWLETLAALRRHEIAHGDLQHGNVLVSQGQIKLIDYDGMYVPALAGLTSHEEGHRNYQHPGRSSTEFGPGLDAFSGWVVLLSLVALAIDPRLWQRLNGGDECLLLRSDDFDKPARSRAFQAILAGRTPELRAIARQVQSFVTMPVARVPSLDRYAINPIILGSGPGHAALPDWLAYNRGSGHMNEIPESQVIDVMDPEPAELYPTWLDNHDSDTAKRPATASLPQKSASRAFVEKVTRNKVLEETVKQSISAYLRERRIDAATIPGVSPEFKERLRAAGITSAADVDGRRIRCVKRITDSEARAIENWASVQRRNAHFFTPLFIT